MTGKIECLILYWKYSIIVKYVEWTSQIYLEYVVLLINSKINLERFYAG